MLLHICTDGNEWCFVEWWSRTTIRTGSGWATCRAFRKTPCLLFSSGKADKDGLGSFMAFQKATEIILKTSIQEYSSTRYVPGSAQLEMFVEIVKRRESFESNSFLFFISKIQCKSRYFQEGAIRKFQLWRKFSTLRSLTQGSPFHPLPRNFCEKSSLANKEMGKKKV